MRPGQHPHSPQYLREGHDRLTLCSFVLALASIDSGAGSSLALVPVGARLRALLTILGRFAVVREMCDLWLSGSTESSF
jgi:hypothetical protein